MNVTTERIKALRDKCGAGIMECRNALIQAEGDIDKALEILKQQSLVKIEKRKQRTATQGLVEAYIHAGGRIGAIVELNCETDFVARTDEFKKLAHELAMQVAACDPKYISPEEIPKEADAEAKSACLLLQPYIRDLNKTIQDLINDIIAKLGENVKITRFARFEVGG